MLHPPNNLKFDTLFNVVKYIFTKFNSKLSKLKVQCYDVAANVITAFNILQAKLRKVK